MATTVEVDDEVITLLEGYDDEVTPFTNTRSVPLLERHTLDEFPHFDALVERFDPAAD